ncbi:hypothetical protein [Gordonia sp. KTR9]|uniref:hypothetical protein n=1 Tax=Gordonia sp. KTR9 TaxID=337191 RepID=UPI0003195A26|nr:hypothetical protein [Gordonia sp. KTR9]
MSFAAHHPVDSATRTCCRGIGAHVPNCDAYLGQLHDLAETLIDATVRAELVGAIWELEDAIDYAPELVSDHLGAVEALVARLVR